MAILPTSSPFLSTGGSGVGPCADDIGDGPLLDQFIRHKDELAFEELVRRHGRMVLGVCRRVLDNPHDAEDCFQAVFLVLVRKATTIQPSSMVGNWLYGVAYRTALEAKKMAARRRIRERRKFELGREVPEPDRWQDVRPVLDRELSRLPDRYRHVLVACDLEGRTRKEVARSLRVPEGTVASRLARARALLARRLTRGGVALSAVGLAALLAHHASAADVPTALAESTANAAAHWTAGKSSAALISTNVTNLVNAVVQSMLLARLKIAASFVLAMFLLAIGIGAFLPGAFAHRPIDAPATTQFKPIVVHDCIIERIDGGKLTVYATRADLESAHAYFEVELRPSTAVIVDGKPAGGDDLRVGALVNVEFRPTSDGRRHAFRIEAIGEACNGVIETVNEVERVVTVHRNEDPQKSYKLDRDAWVIINGKKAKLAELKAKMNVSLCIPSGKPVTGVHAAGPKVSGLVKAYDGKTLSLGAESISVNADTLVRVGGRTGTLADIRAGLSVTVQMSAEPQSNAAVVILVAGRP